MVLVPVVGGGVIALALKWYQKHCKSRAHREKETGWTIKSAQPAYIFNHAMNEITFNDCQVLGSLHIIQIGALLVTI